MSDTPKPSKTTEVAPKPGDKVTHVIDLWVPPPTIDRIERCGGRDFAFFVEGGFWALDRIRKVSRT